MLDFDFFPNSIEMKSVWGSRNNQHLPQYLRFNHITCWQSFTQASLNQNITFFVLKLMIVQTYKKEGKICDFLRSRWISVWSSGAGWLEGVCLPTTLSPLLPPQTRHTLNGSNASSLLIFFKPVYFWSMFPALIWRNSGLCFEKAYLEVLLMAPIQHYQLTRSLEIQKSRNSKIRTFWKSK